MPNAQRGFTLLEMLVVIVLISIAAGLVVLACNKACVRRKSARRSGRSSRRCAARAPGRLSVAPLKAPSSICAT